MDSMKSPHFLFSAAIWACFKTPVMPFLKFALALAIRSRVDLRRSEIDGSSIRKPKLFVQQQYLLQFRVFFVIRLVRLFYAIRLKSWQIMKVLQRNQVWTDNNTLGLVIACNCHLLDWSGFRYLQSLMILWAFTITISTWVNSSIQSLANRIFLRLASSIAVAELSSIISYASPFRW